MKRKIPEGLQERPNPNVPSSEATDPWGRAETQSSRARSPWSQRHKSRISQNQSSGAARKAKQRENGDDIRRTKKPGSSVMVAYRPTGLYELKLRESCESPLQNRPIWRPIIDSARNLYHVDHDEHLRITLFGNHVPPIFGLTACLIYDS